MVPVLFEKVAQKTVLPGALFWSDACKLSVQKGRYLMFQSTIVGNDIPYTPDKITPAYGKEKNKFKQSGAFPQPNLVACNRTVKKRIGFLGASITQGLGTQYGRYEFWVAKIGERLGNEYSVWNLG